MANIYGPSGSRRRTPGQRRSPNRDLQRLPTLEDYQQLAQAYQELTAHYQELQGQLEPQNQLFKETQQELAVKTEVLERQSADLKELEAELVWTKAALEQAQQQQKAVENEKEADESPVDDENWQERYQRLQAEMENLRKRREQRYNNEITEARHRILLDMLPLADHLDLALQYSDMLQEETSKTFLGSIEATRSAFLETLKRYGVTPVGEINEVFDPKLHEAMGEVEDGSIPADHIAQIVQAGYVEGEKLLRPARVLVSKGQD